MQEDNAATSIQAQLSGVETKLNNLVEAITQGIYSSTTKKALDELEERKRNLEIELFEAQTRNPVLTKEQILFALYNFRKIDISTQEGKQRLIDGFVNSIYLYDDHFVITYNYKGQSKTVTFEELNSSPLTSKGSPTNGSTDMCFRFSLRYCRRMGSGGSPDRQSRSHGAQAEYSRVTTDIHGIALKVVFLIYKFSRKSQQTALINSKLLCTHKLKSGSGTQRARPFLRINFYLSSVISLRNSS